MDAVEFIKTVNRLCKNQICEECPVYKNGMCCMVGFDDDSIKNIEETVSKVEQWAKDHPVKTHQSEFLKMFPNANIKTITASLSPCVLDREENPHRCAKYGYLSISCRCIKCRDDFWNEEVSE